MEEVNITKIKRVLPLHIYIYFCGPTINNFNNLIIPPVPASKTEPDLIMIIL